MIACLREAASGEGRGIMPYRVVMEQNAFVLITPNCLTFVPFAFAAIHKLPLKNGLHYSHPHRGGDCQSDQ